MNKDRFENLFKQSDNVGQLLSQYFILFYSTEYDFLK